MIPIISIILSLIVSIISFIPAMYLIVAIKGVFKFIFEDDSIRKYPTMPIGEFLIAILISMFVFFVIFKIIYKKLKEKYSYVLEE